MVHLDDIGCRPNKNWFLLNDTTVRTDRLMSLVQLPADCVALEEMPPSECPKGVLMELLASLQHPYIYPVLDLGIFFTNQTPYACLVMPFNVRGSLKDLIYKVSTDGLWLQTSICSTIWILFIYSRNGMNHGRVNTRKNQRACRCRRYSDWVDKYWKHFYFCANAVFHRTAIYTAAMSFCKMEWRGKLYYSCSVELMNNYYCCHSCVVACITSPTIIFNFSI